MKMSDNPAKHEVLIKQYLCSMLDISVIFHPEVSPLFGKFCNRKARIVRIGDLYGTWGDFKSDKEPLYSTHAS